jgi:hypothetical protein
MMGNSPSVYEKWRKAASVDQATWQLYVGANNETGQIELNALQSVLSGFHAGYTIVHGSGVWQNASEPCVVVTISCSEQRARATAARIRDVLRQQAVGLVQVGPGMEMV